MGIHGGTDETSLMLHLAPELVDMSVATRNVPEQLAANRYVRFGGTVGFGWLSNDFGPDGHIGDPTTATAERGADAVRRRRHRVLPRRSPRWRRSSSVADMGAARSLPTCGSTSTGCSARIEALGEIGAVDRPERRARAAPASP